MTRQKRRPRRGSAPELRAAERDLVRRGRRRAVPDFVVERQRWKLALLHAHVERHGWDGVHRQLVIAPGVQIGAWAQACRDVHKRGKLAPWLRDGLDAIPGWRWSGRMGLESGSREKVALLRRFMQERGWARLPSPVPEMRHRGVDLRACIVQWRGRYAAGELPKNLAQALDAVPGWEWSGEEGQQREVVALARSLLDRRIDGKRLDLPTLLDLGSWILHRRAACAAGTLSPQLRRQLERIPGWTWSQKEGPRYHRRGGS